MTLHADYQPADITIFDGLCVLCSAMHNSCCAMTAIIISFWSLRIVPLGVRDPLYRLIARNRYRLFGRRESCWVPSASDRRQFR